MTIKQTAIQQEVDRAVKQYLQTAGSHTYGSLHQELIQQVEYSLLVCVLNHTEQNQTMAANILGVSRTTLRKKLKTYQLI